MPSVRVLLIEDEDAYARIVELELAGSDVLLRTVASLHEAGRLLHEQRFDAILLDLNLPDSHGLDTVTAVYRMATDVPIVVLTASGDEDTAVRAVQLGADDYLFKGEADSRALVRALRYAIERSGLRRSMRESEARFRQAQKMEAVGRLAGGIAHDFNNVLTAIFGYVDLLATQFGRDDPRLQDVLEIRRSAERAAALTRQLLAFGRKQLMTPRTLELNVVIGNIEQLIMRLVGGRIEVRLRPDPGLWPVRADQGQIEQVLMNLAANAHDAMPDGGRLEIATGNATIGEEIDQRPGLKAGDYAVLSVRDSGTGIPQQIREQIFEPFFTTKEPGKGTGLGLASVYGIVKQSGGGVYVESEEGRGTTFLIYLPRTVETLNVEC